MWCLYSERGDGARQGAKGDQIRRISAYVGLHERTYVRRAQSVLQDQEQGQKETAVHIQEYAYYTPPYSRVERILSLQPK